MESSSEKAELRIGYLSTIYHTSFLLRSTCSIEKMGLDTKWVLFGGGPAIVEAFAKRELDIGYIGLPPVMIGIDKGIGIKCIAGGHIEGTVFIGKNNYQSLVELGNDNNAFFEQFRGSKIGAPPAGSIHDVILRFYINKIGMDDEIIIKNFDWADFIPGAILNDELEAAVGTPPLAVLCARTFNSKILMPPDTLWPYNPSYGIVTSTDIIEVFPKLLEEFLKLHEEATQQLMTKADWAAEKVSKIVKVVDHEFILQSFELSPKYCASLPEKYIDSTLAFIPILKKLKYIDKDLGKSDIFDLRFINKLHQTQPHYDLKVN
ncbi:MAG: ABC transporter substrate-binding protein [Thermoplasmata archaeon]|nr:ABC transporter substrate-binding protein [Thermoplasmata archaeon]